MPTRFQVYWATLVQKNPALIESENKVTLRISELERLLKKAHLSGYEAGAADARPHKDNSLFGKIFGGGDWP